MKAWREANPEKNRAKSRRYRAQKNGLEGDFTPEEWEQLKAATGHICLACGTPEDEQEFTMEADHVIPVGQDDSTNYITNIQPLCKSCNCSKGENTTDYRVRVLA